tara:strand:- start:1543 stop:2142 length:600 start_codon:yes stop_codon:yes gene_type:complete
MSNLNDFYKKNSVHAGEGYSQQLPEQSKFLREMVNKENVKNVMEIGFNAGHSAELFLSSNKNINLVSFDIGEHLCSLWGKNFIDQKYPNRHKLILGDSTKTVPEFSKKNNIKFDVIFIDGGHTYDIALADIKNCKELAHSGTIVIVDDIVRRMDYMLKRRMGPKQAWNAAKKMGIINMISYKDYERGRGNVWGKYILNK